MPDISTINGVDIATLASFNGVALADGQTLEGQNIALGGADAHTLISTQTASSSSSVSFTSGIDSTYDVYEWHFINLHPSYYGSEFQFQVNAVGQSGFNETMTTTFYYAYNRYPYSSYGYYLDPNKDQSQGAGYHTLGMYLLNSNEQGVSGILRLYAPSNTTYVKHFIALTHEDYAKSYSINYYTAGYINTTSAIDEINFRLYGGNIDAGEIRMYGVATS